MEHKTTTVPTVTLSRGTATLLEFKDQEATAGGLWFPHFTPTMLWKIKEVVQQRFTWHWRKKKTQP